MSNVMNEAETIRGLRSAISGAEAIGGDVLNIYSQVEFTLCQTIYLWQDRAGAKELLLDLANWLWVMPRTDRVSSLMGRVTRTRKLYDT